MPAHSQGLMPAHSQGLMPAQSQGLLPAQSQGLVPEARSSEQGLMPAESQGLMPAHNRGLMPAQSQGLLPAQSQGLVPEARSSEQGLMPAESQGLMPEAQSRAWCQLRSRARVSICLKWLNVPQIQKQGLSMTLIVLTGLSVLNQSVNHLNMQRTNLPVGPFGFK